MRGVRGVIFLQSLAFAGTVEYLCRMYKLSREELRIIEETKKQGAAQPVGRRVRAWALIVWIAVFILFAVGIRLLFAWVS